jgi:DNA recombination protein RmuC
MEIILGIGIAVGLSVVVWVLVQWLKSMQNTVQGSTSEVSRRLNELNRQIGEISELGRGMKSLQEFLQSPKLRGNIGEQVLKDMIGQTFPKNSFHLQHSFKSGVKVDAVLKTDAGLLCIDSKFPMENFKLMHKGETEAMRITAKRDFIADVKKHITDISRKYILPEEGTMDFALMYIPSESVYYEIATIEDLMDFSRRSRVYPVSPNTLYAHLQVLLLSFQGKELEQKSREVFRLLRAIQKDYEKTGEQLGVLGRHIGNAYNTMSGVSGTFDVLGQKLSKTQRFTGREEKQLEE